MSYSWPSISMRIVPFTTISSMSCGWSCGLRWLCCWPRGCGTMSANTICAFFVRIE
jgi:hypothetical protein